MREAPAHVAFFGDGEKTFRLTPELIVELERVTGTGIGSLSRRVFSSDFRHGDILDLIRLGLIGGGTEPQEAAALIAAYAAPMPIMSVYPVALAILETALFGQAQVPANTQEAAE